MLLPPLGLAALAAQLRRRGVETRVFDCTFGTIEGLRADLRAFRPDIVGLSSMVSLTRNTLRIAGMVQADLPGCLVVAGGPLPTVFPGRYIGHVDAVFRGEADVSFPRFCVDYLGSAGLAGATSASWLSTRTPGCSCRPTACTSTTRSCTTARASSPASPCPTGATSTTPPTSASGCTGPGTRSPRLFATLGCPYSCDFCSRPVFGNVVRHRDLDTVFAEIDEIRELGYDSLWIADDTFTLDPAYLEAFCRRIAPLGMTWTCLSRANGIDLATMRLMKAGGLPQGLPRARVGKPGDARPDAEADHGRAGSPHDRACIARPGSTWPRSSSSGTRGRRSRRSRRPSGWRWTLPLDEISFNVPVPLPGSTLFERLGGPDEGRDWEQENEVTFLYPSEIDEAWLKRRIDETMRAFAAKK